VGDYFSWARRCRVPLFYHKDGEGERKLWQAQARRPALPCLVMDADVLAVRELTPEIVALQGDAEDAQGKVWLLQEAVRKPAQICAGLCAPAAGDAFTTFVSYAEGWGKFVTGACINKGAYPFWRPERFSSGDRMSPNERRVLALWRRMDRLYSALAR
jgi:hypothetical protein